MHSNDKPISGIIYKTTNLINNKWYIGKDEINNPRYLGSGIQLQRAIKKYGIENFKKEIIDRADTRLSLCNLERKIIEETNAVNDPMSYNIANGGYGGGKGFKLTLNEREELLSLYKSGISLTHLSTEFKCHRETIWKYLRKLLPNDTIDEIYNKPIQHRKMPVSEMPHVINLYKSGMTISELSIKYKISAEFVRIYIRQILHDKILPNKYGNSKKSISDDQLPELFELYKSGISSNELSQKYKTHPKVLKRYLKKLFPELKIIRNNYKDNF